MSMLQRYIEDSLCSWHCVISSGQPLQYWVGFSILQFSLLIGFLSSQAEPLFGEASDCSIIE
jgi:hypothetical protein